MGQCWTYASGTGLSLTFGRRITGKCPKEFTDVTQILIPSPGVHNPTDGIIFDIIQCLIQRDFSYATQDIRNAYQEVKKALLDPKYKKVVFIIHSQGGIEGGMIVDWLLNEGQPFRTEVSLWTLLIYHSPARPA